MLLLTKYNVTRIHLSNPSGTSPEEAIFVLPCDLLASFDQGEKSLTATGVAPKWRKEK